MDNDVLRLGDHQMLRVVSTTEGSLEVESIWQPGPPPRPHWHPYQSEDFSVLEGELTVELGGRQVTLAVGDTVEVPPRTVHRMWNPGPGETRARWRITPPQQTAAMFRRIDRGLGPVSSLAFLWRFRREYRIGQPR